MDILILRIGVAAWPETLVQVAALVDGKSVGISVDRRAVETLGGRRVATRQR